MSLEAAIGRIDQILQLQQQVANPSAAATTSGSSAAAAPSAPSAGGGAAASSFASMLAGAQQPAPGALTAPATPGTTPTPTPTGGTGLTDPISSGVTNPLAATLPTGSAGTAAGAPAQLQAMVTQADSLLGKPYVWGGGHGGWGPQTGYDCSGFVSAVLHAGGYLSAPQDTQTLPSQPGIAAGPGQYVTIYDRTDAGGSDHVIIDLGGQFYESGGEQGAWGGGGGVAKIATPPASYLQTFNLVLHPQGL